MRLSCPPSFLASVPRKAGGTFFFKAEFKITQCIQKPQICCTVELIRSFLQPFHAVFPRNVVYKSNYLVEVHKLRKHKIVRSGMCFYVGLHLALKLIRIVLQRAGNTSRWGPTFRPKTPVMAGRSCVLNLKFCKARHALGCDAVEV